MMQDIMKTIIEMTVYSSAMIVAVMVLSKLFSDKLSTKIVYALWIVALIRLMLPMTLESPYRFPFPASFAAQEPATVAPTPVADGSFAVGNTDMEYIDRPYTEIPMLNAQPQQISAPSPKAIRNLDIWSMIFAVWLTGALSYLTHNLYRIIIYNKKIKNIVSTDIRYINKLESIKKLLKIRRNIIIAESKYADIPFVYGYFAPKVLFPLGFFNAVDDEKLSYIVLHELSHVKRRDVAMNYVWMAAKAIHWFNPLIYFAYKAYKNAVEESCDEAVARLLDTQGRAQYSQSLIDTMRFSKKRYRTPLSVSFSGRESAIRKRVIKMMYPQKNSKAILYITVLLASIMVLACFTTACQPADDISIMDLTANAAADDEMPQETGEESSQPLETPIPTPDVTENYDTNNISQPIKRIPVGSEEAAIEIAKKINISDGESFTYVASYDRGPMKVHNVKSDQDVLADYHIYDVNGEIYRLQTSALMTKEVGDELSKEELIQKVIDFSKRIYPNTILDISSCVKDDLSWTMDGVTYESKDYIVKGVLTDSVDGSARSFTSYIRLDGCMKSVKAEYSGMDFLGMADDVKNKIMSYTQDNDGEIDIFQIDDYYGDRMLHFQIGDGKDYVSLLASDMSLVDYMNVPNQTDAEFDLTDSQVDELVQQYADRYFPGNTNVIIDDEQVMDKDYVGIGKLTDSRGEMYFYIQLNGDGKVHKIGIRPNVDKESLPRIDKSEALQVAIDSVLRECTFIEESELDVLSEAEYKDEYHEGYNFEFMYTSPNPTIRDYSFKAYVSVDVHTGKYYSLRIAYIEDGLDVLSKEEAIEKAKEYVVASFNLDPEKLVFKEFIVMWGNILEFQANFDYEDGKSYGASMYADTGELDGIVSGGP